MSEKRFVACDKWADSEGNIFRFVVIDTKVLGDKQFILRCNHWIEAQDICNRLNDTLDELREENEQLKQELQGMEELLQSYRKTIKHDAELLADASKKGYLPPLNDYVSTEGWICGCCKHFHSGVRDRCDKDNNWVLKNGSCQDFER